MRRRPRRRDEAVPVRAERRAGPPVRQRTGRCAGRRSRRRSRSCGFTFPLPQLAGTCRAAEGDPAPEAPWTCGCQEGKPALCGAFLMPGVALRGVLVGQCCQCTQRLLKVLHRDDPQVACWRRPRRFPQRARGRRRLLLRRAPIVFCLRPPTGVTAPSSSIAPVTATRLPAVDVAAELLHHVEREREPAEGPPTPPESMSTSSGSSMSASCPPCTPMIGLPFSTGISTVLISSVLVCRRRGRGSDGVARLARDQPAEVAGVLTRRRRRRRSRRRLDLAARRVPRGGSHDDERSAPRRDDVVAELREARLRPRSPASGSSRAGLASPAAVARARRGECIHRHERGALADAPATRARAATRLRTSTSTK